jgi:tetratricopeptide (TPR) repeat protein
MAAYGMNDLARAQSFLAEALTHYESGTLSDGDAHLQMVLTLGNIHLRRDQLDEAARRAQQALDLAEAGESELDIERQASALHLIGNVAMRQGDRDAALQQWNEAIRRLGDARHQQVALLRCDIAQARKTGGDYRAALNEYEKALVMLNHIDHLPTRGLVLSNAATLYTDMGDADTAQAFYEESIEIAQKTGDPHTESLRLGNYGRFLALTGQAQAAIDRLETALKISRHLDDTLLIAVQTNNLARTYRQLQDYETARALHKQSLAAATAIDAERWLAVFQSDMAATLIALNRADEAEPLLREALERSERFADLETTVHTQTRLATLCAQTGRANEAETFAAQAAEQARKMRYKRGIADAEAVLGDLARARGDDGSAREHYAEAHRLYTMLRDPAAQRLESYLPESA